MATMTLQIPTAQIGWFEQMVRTMGWTFTRKDVVEEDVRSEITPALRRRINKARKESERGETIRCNNKAEMEQYFASL
jgi:hypothetical protein